jgi:thiazole synthase ThiGH ThiG subunit
MERVYDLLAKSAAFQRIPYALSDSFGFATQEQSDPGLRQSVLLNTAVSRALDPVRMAGAFANATRAGRPFASDLAQLPVSVGQRKVERTA